MNWMSNALGSCPTAAGEAKVFPVSVTSPGTHWTPNLSEPLASNIKTGKAAIQTAAQTCPQHVARPQTALEEGDTAALPVRATRLTSALTFTMRQGPHLSPRRRPQTSNQQGRKRGSLPSLG